MYLILDILYFLTHIVKVPRHYLKRICTKTIFLIQYKWNSHSYYPYNNNNNNVVCFHQLFTCEWIELYLFRVINHHYIFLPKRLCSRKEIWVQWLKRTHMDAANHQGQVMLPLLKPCLVPEKLLFMSLLSTQVIPNINSFFVIYWSIEFW
jgi:hypothetical protein